MAAPSWLPTLPPTPMRRSRRACFRCFTRPRSLNTFSCARSRTEQVLNRIRSAFSGWSVISKPFAARSRSAILSESYSFIWQPNVRMNSFFAMSPALGARPRELVGCQQPHAKNLPVAIQAVGGPRPLARNGYRHDDQVLAIADDRARGELHRFVVHGYGHLLDVADIASPGVLRDRARPRLSENRYGPKEGRKERKAGGSAWGHGARSRRNGGESGTRTPDLRIMIPSL